MKRRPLLGRGLSLPLVVAIALLSGPRLRPAAAQEDSRTRKVPEHNFRLRIPAAWKWDVPPSSSCLLYARRDDPQGQTRVGAYVRVRDADGTTLSAGIDALRESLGRPLKDVVAETIDFDWAGVAGRRLTLSGRHPDIGKMVAWEAYVAVVEGESHELRVVVEGDREAIRREELDELVQGYRVLREPPSTERRRPICAPSRNVARPSIPDSSPPSRTLRDGAAKIDCSARGSGRPR